MKVSVAVAKRTFGDLLSRVAYGRETVTILRYGKPVARLVPTESSQIRGGGEPLLSEWHGFLDHDDPFFSMIDEIVADRRRHKLRPLTFPQ